MCWKTLMTRAKRRQAELEDPKVSAELQARCLRPSILLIFDDTVQLVGRSPSSACMTHPASRKGDMVDVQADNPSARAGEPEPEAEEHRQGLLRRRSTSLGDRPGGNQPT